MCDYGKWLLPATKLTFHPLIKIFYCVIVFATDYLYKSAFECRICRQHVLDVPWTPKAHLWLHIDATQ